LCISNLFGQWHPEITHRPRLVYLSSEISTIRNRLSSGIYNQLWNNSYDDRKGQSVNGIYWMAYQFEESTPNTPNEPRAFTDRRARIAKSAAFVFVMNKRADGITNLDNFTGPNDPHPRDWYKGHALEYLQELDDTILDLGQPIDYPTTAKYTDNWQWRVKEILYYLQAYDMLLGAGLEGIPRDLAIEQKLANMVNSLLTQLDYLFIRGLIVPFNNHYIMLNAAFGLAAITLNDHPDAQEWINEAMSMNEYILWGWPDNGNTPMIDGDGGFGEGPFYWKYSIKHLIPFFIAMKNFNGDWTEEYFNGRFIRSPLFDTRYNKIYDWLTKIRMPEGRLPALEDTYQDSYLFELAILGEDYFWKYESFDPNISNEALLNAELASLFDLRVEFIVAGNENTTNTSGFDKIQILPAAGSAVFRSDWGTNATYLHFYGQHDGARFMGGTHDHADVSSFILGYKGKVLALDAGYIKWEDHYKVNKPENHNLVLVDGYGPRPPSGPVFVIKSSFPFFQFYFSAAKGDGYIQNDYTGDNYAYAEVTTNYGQKYEMFAEQDGQEAHRYLSSDNTSVDFTRGILFVDETYFIVFDDIDNQNSDILNYEWLCHGNAGGSAGGSAVSMPGGMIWENGDVKLRSFTTALGGITSSSNALYKHGDGFNTIKEHSTAVVSKQSIDTQFLSVLFPYDTGIIDPPIAEFSNNNYTGIFIDRSNVAHGSRYDVAISQKNGGAINVPQMTFGSIIIKSIDTDAEFLTISFDPNDPHNPETMQIFGKNSSYLKYNGNVFFFPENNITTQFTYFVKNHLESSNATATAANNARRMVKDDNGALHVAYVDNNSIWYAYSDDDGETRAGGKHFYGSNADFAAPYM